MSLITPSLVAHILEDYALPRTGVHGVAHWARVLENGRRLASLTPGVDLDVIELFAVFHDSRRVNESIDWGHGKRGGALAKQLLGEYFQLGEARFALLQYACEEHTSGKIKGDPTVQVCWDADRLDLLRVGILPNASRLCCEAARRPYIMEWANNRALRFEVPRLIGQEWGLQL